MGAGPAPLQHAMIAVQAVLLVSMLPQPSSFNWTSYVSIHAYAGSSGL